MIEHFERLPIEIEVSVEATTMMLRDLLGLAPGTVLPCSGLGADRLAIRAGGQVVGYGRMEEDACLGVRIVSLPETML
jgi:flagellar motor switch/type III secretory pathway protein FliN